MAKEENLNLLESMKEAIMKDPHLHDRVLAVIRQVRSTTGQSLDDYMKKKEDLENSVIEKRKRETQT